MTTIVSDYFRINQAKQLLAQFTTSSFYTALAKTTPWASPNSDNYPAIPLASVNDLDYKVWNDMLGVKKVASGDVSLAIRRVDWVSGTIYDQYDSADDVLLTKDFYVVTDELKVYKVLSNAGGGASTVKPTSTSTSAFVTGDNYRWKFMYQISPAAAEKLSTPQFVPVQTITSNDGSLQWSVQAAAVSGTIDGYTVTQNGSGYSTVTVTITGDGTGATATGVLSGGSLVRIDVTSPGTGYTYANAVVSGDGTGATALANLSPKGGHGKDAVRELGGYFVQVVTEFKYDEGGIFTTANDFRKVILVKDPTTFGTSTVAIATAGDQTTHLVLSASTGTFVADEVLTGGTSGATARLVDKISNDIRVSENVGTFSASETITGGTSGATGTIQSITNPYLQPRSGDVLYVENRKPQPRNPDQIERIYFTVEC